MLDCTHLGAEVLETKLPDITEFARTYLGVDPVYEPVPVMPTAHYAMGGIPTKICGEPAWDPDFNAADFPVLLDMDAMDERYRRHFGLPAMPATAATEQAAPAQGQARKVA